MGSRFLLTISANTVEPSACVGTGVGLREATAGTPAKFALAAWDGYGNVSNPDLDLFHVSIVGIESPITLVATGRQ
eukprot:5636832-Prymnesium_polylepis.1